jgi:hypothetical protein
MNAVDIWHHRAGECYRMAWVSTCPLTRTGALLVAADYLDKAVTVAAEAVERRPSAKIIPFVRRAA